MSSQVTLAVPEGRRVRRIPLAAADVGFIGERWAVTRPMLRIGTTYVPALRGWHITHRATGRSVGSNLAGQPFRRLAKAIRVCRRLDAEVPSFRTMPEWRARAMDVARSLIVEVSR